MDLVRNRRKLLGACWHDAYSFGLRLHRQAFGKRLRAMLCRWSQFSTSIITNPPRPTRVLLRFTGCRSALSPSRPRPFHFANRALVTSGICNVPHERPASVCGSAAALRSGCDSLCAPLRSPLHFPRSPTADRSVLFSNRLFPKCGSMYLTQIGTKTKKPALYLLGKPRPKDEICVKYILPPKCEVGLYLSYPVLLNWPGNGSGHKIKRPPCLNRGRRIFPSARQAIRADLHGLR